MGLRRFIACRGSHYEIISDNAGQFKLASGTIDKGLRYGLIKMSCHMQAQRTLNGNLPLSLHLGWEVFMSGWWDL